MTNSDLSADPRPCPSCGSAVCWRLPSGAVRCECDGDPVPEGSTLVVMARHLGGPAFWEPHPWAAPVVDNPEPLDLIDPDELTPCPKCGKLELWQNILGGWRCEHCDPQPQRAVRFQRSSETVVRRAKQGRSATPERKTQ